MAASGQRIVIVGATGLIGAHVAAALTAEGADITGVARHVGGWPLRRPDIEWRSLDLAKADAERWRAAVAGADAVIFCAGALQDGPRDDLSGTHERGLKALISACEAENVRRFIHFSAMGVDRATPTEFSRSKFAGDQALIASGLDWVILRPSVVLGHSVYGASALIRGLAALPVLPVMPDTAPLRPVALEDVVATVSFFLRPDASARVALDVSGPETFDFASLVALHRRWLGWRPAWRMPLPRWAAALAYRLGDIVSLLGWRPPVRSTARREIARGAASGNEGWLRLIGLQPGRIGDLLDSRPASVQERWFAGLYFVKPLIFGSLALFWIGSGLASLGPGYAQGIEMMRQGGIEALAPLIVIGGGVADLLVGIGIAWRPHARAALLAGILVSLLYAAAGTLVTPWLWLDPLAPLLKIAPVIALHLAALAILEDR
jgi:uncharacterized protein YbjT (DUF2867 family)